MYPAMTEYKIPWKIVNKSKCSLFASLLVVIIWIELNPQQYIVNFSNRKDVTTNQPKKDSSIHCPQVTIFSPTDGLLQKQTSPDGNVGFNIERGSSFNPEKSGVNANNLESNIIGAPPLDAEAPQLRAGTDPDWRLGNEMFVLAAMTGLTAHSGTSSRGLTAHSSSSSRGPRVCLPSYSQLRQVFEADQYPDCRPAPGEVAVKRPLGAVYDPQLHIDLNATEDILLVGYFQSWKYFTNVQTHLRQNVFKFKPLFREAAIERILEFYQSRVECSDLKVCLLWSVRFKLSECCPGTVVVGVHVRRGDLHNAQFKDHGFVAAPIDYITSAMELFRQDLTSSASHKHILFIVVSQDLQWTRENLPLTPDVVFSPSGSVPGVDLAILTSCDHVIITVGTFGWWGAWMAGGSTIYYKDWPRAGSTLDNRTRHEDYFPPHWIGLKLADGKYRRV